MLDLFVLVCVKASSVAQCVDDTTMDLNLSLNPEFIQIGDLNQLIL